MTVARQMPLSQFPARREVGRVSSLSVSSHSPRAPNPPHPKREGRQARANSLLLHSPLPAHTSPISNGLTLSHLPTPTSVELNPRQASGRLVIVLREQSAWALQGDDSGARGERGRQAKLVVELVVELERVEVEGSKGHLSARA